MSHCFSKRIEGESSDTPQCPFRKKKKVTRNLDYDAKHTGFCHASVNCRDNVTKF